MSDKIPTTSVVPDAKPRKRWHKPVLYTVAGLTIFTIGTAAGGGSSTATPVPAITVTAEPITETVTVTEVPQSCKDALADADALQQISSEMADSVVTHLGSDSRLFEQFAGLDFENLDWYLADQETFGADIDALTARIQVNTYAVNRDACLTS